MILLFSGCGNSRFVAEQMAALTDDKVFDIGGENLSASPAEEFHGGVLGIVCPVYAWSIPRVVARFIAALPDDRKPGYCYLACTCGDNVGRTPERLNSLLKKKGWHLDAAFSFVMPETYINLPGFSLDSPENEKRKIDAVREKLPSVADRIKRREHTVDVVRGAMPRFNSHVVNPLFYSLLITDRKFRVADSCVGCGICADSCPLKNIDMVDGRPRWKGNCTNCMSCYHRCPHNAINFGKATLGKGQYYFGKNH